MARCYLKGFRGSVLNAHLAAAAWNFRKWIRKGIPFTLIATHWRAVLNLWHTLFEPIPTPRQQIQILSAA